MALRDARGWHRAGPFAGTRGPEPPEPPEPPAPRPPRLWHGARQPRTLPAALAGSHGACPAVCAAGRGNVCKVLETSRWQTLTLGLPETTGDSAGCIDTGGSGDVSLTSARGCPSAMPAPSTTKACELTEASRCRWRWGFVRMCHPPELAGPVLRGCLTPGSLQSLTACVSNSSEQGQEVGSSVPFHPALPRSPVV